MTNDFKKDVVSPVGSEQSSKEVLKSNLQEALKAYDDFLMFDGESNTVYDCDNFDTEEEALKIIAKHDELAENVGIAFYEMTKEYNRKKDTIDYISHGIKIKERQERIRKSIADLIAPDHTKQ